MAMMNGVTVPQPYTNPAAQTITGWYQQYLGRPATDQEIASQTGNGRYVAQTNLDWARNQIANSAEAQAYAKAKAAAAANPSTNTNPNTAPNTNANTATPASYRFTGFDFARSQDPTKSAKDAFAEASKTAAGAGVASTTWQTKAGAQAFAEQYIKPVLEKYGYTVLEIRGDKMRVITREDREAGRTQGTWVDFVKNAGGTNPDDIELQWGAETAPDGTDPTTGWTAPNTATNATTPTSGTNPVGGRTEVGNTSAGTISDVAYDPLAPNMADLPYYAPYY